MRPLLRMLALLFLGVVVHNPSAAAAQEAQEAQDSRIPTWDQSHLAEGYFTVRVARAFGFCSVDGRRRSVETLLQTEPYSPEEWDAVQALFAEPLPQCYAGNWRAVFRSVPFIRGIVAEYLYKKLNRRPLANTALPLNVSYETYLRRWSSSDGRALPQRVTNELTARWVATCATAAVPRAVHDVIRFDSGSPGETRALRALRPVLYACLPPDRALRVSRLTMRALLAEALYQASESQREAFRNAQG